MLKFFILDATLVLMFCIELIEFHRIWSFLRLVKYGPLGDGRVIWAILGNEDRIQFVQEEIGRKL